MNPEIIENENQETNEQMETEVEQYPKLEIININDVLVPAELLPSTVPSLQRLRDAPNKFFTLTVSVDFGDVYKKFYFLTDGTSLIDLERMQMYYITNLGNVYRFAVSKHLLPKSLAVYSRGKVIRVSEVSENGGIIDVDVERFSKTSKTIHIKGSLKQHGYTILVVSILFHVISNYPDLLFE